MRSGDTVIGTLLLVGVEQSTRKSGVRVNTGTCGVLRGSLQDFSSSSTPRRASPKKYYNKDSASIRRTVQSDSFASLITHGFTRSDQRSEETVVRDIRNTAEQRDPFPPSPADWRTSFNKASHNVSWSTPSCRCMETQSKKKTGCIVSSSFLRNVELFKKALWHINKKFPG